jgi:hypothetical protein
MARTTIAMAALLVCAVAGCSSKTNKMCGPQDAGVIEVGLEAPVGCPPAEANENGIGIPCTMCGNECPSTLRCTCDPYLGVQLTGVPCICTKLQIAQTGSTDPCAETPASFCGSNATCCAVLTTAAYCVPNVCLIGGACIDFTPPDAGADGESDAATD